MNSFVGKKPHYEKYVRLGDNHKIVMTSDGVVEEWKAGVQSLLKLACSKTFIPVEPRYRKVLVEWEKSKIPGQTGKCYFPENFDGSLPVDFPTNRHLAFYKNKCGKSPMLVDLDDTLIHLATPHYVVDITYRENYRTDYAYARTGLERHDFCHLYYPLSDHSGYLIIGKLIRNDSESTSCIERGELYLTAFKVPKLHGLFLPEFIIHSNDYMLGTWRTMLADGVPVDGVQQLLRTSRAGHALRPRHFMFQFNTQPEADLQCTVSSPK